MGRVLILVAAFLVALLLMCCAVLYLMSDDDYRAALIWSADFFYETELEIDGTFAIDFGRKTQLNAEEIRLKASDGSYVLSLGEVHIEQNVEAYIETGTLWISSLRLTDLSVEVLESESEKEIDWRDFSIPSVVMEKVEFNNVSLTYTEDNQQQHSYKLSYFELDENDEQSPVEIRAAGMIEKQQLKLGGTFGSLAKLRDIYDDQGQPYPLKFSLSRDSTDNKSARTDASIILVDGSIRNSSSGNNFIELRFDVDLSELAGVFSEGVSPNKLGLLQGNLSLSDEDGRWRIKKIDLASNKTSLYQLGITGSVDGLNQNAHIDLQSKLTVPSPAALGEVLGIDLSDYQAYTTATGVIKGNKTALNFKGNTTIGRIVSEVILDASLKKGKPIIKGKLIIPVLYLADIGIEDSDLVAVESGASAVENLADDSKQLKREEWKVWKFLKRRVKTPVSKNKTYIFDREPLDFVYLQNIEMNLSIQIDKVEGAGYSIDQLTGELKLAKGVLHIAPVQLVFEKGVTNIEFKMDTRKTPEFTLKLQADNLILGQLISQLQSEVPVKGEANLLLDVNSKGLSAHDLASNLVGSLRFGLEDASIPSKYLEYLSVDVFGWVLSQSRLEDVYTQLDCIAMDFDIKQGVASSQLLIAGGPSLFVSGAASVDLGEETIDMVLLPRQKKNLFSKMPPVKIKGPLKHPIVQALPKTAAATTIATTVLLPGIIIPQYVIKKFWKREDSSALDCAKLAEKYRAK